MIQAKVLEAGFFATVQDLGRTSGRPYGVPPGGAMDLLAHRAANELVGNSSEAATLEIAFQAPALYFETDALISLTGANFQPIIDGIPRPLWASLYVRAWQTLSFQANSATTGSGRLVYLAVHGGWAAPIIMGSRSAYVRGGMGHALSVGEILTSGQVYQQPLKYYAPAAARFYPASQIPAYSRTSPLAVPLILGPHLANFSAQAQTDLLNTTYQVAPESDRMGYRLQGAALAYARPDMAEIAACGTVWGAVQVPPDGQPIILMADHQVTGGYPIIGVVRQAALPFVAQLLPGQTLHFQL